jgi:4-oxalocrotonate tautomerase
MPILTLKLAPPQGAALCATLSEALTTVTVQTLAKRGELTAVVIDELPCAHWTIGAQVVKRPTAWLEFTVTAGTNSAAQKAAFIAAAFATLQRLLAPEQGLEPTSYVAVRELASSDWGYGGRTQQARATPAGGAEAVL